MRERTTGHAGTNKRPALSIQEVRARPTISVDEYASFTGLGRNLAYKAISSCDVETLRIGKRVLVLTGPLLRAMKVDDADEAA